MPPTIAQDVASIIATRAESFLEQYEGSGVINLTPAQKQAIARELLDVAVLFDSTGQQDFSVTAPEWRSSPENVGKRWITVVTTNTTANWGLVARVTPNTDLDLRPG